MSLPTFPIRLPFGPRKTSGTEIEAHSTKICVERISVVWSGYAQTSKVVSLFKVGKNTKWGIDNKRKKYYHYSIDLEKQTDPVRQEMETKSMKPRKEDTLFVYKTHLFVNNNDCLHGKSNRNFRQILEYFF